MPYDLIIIGSGPGGYCAAVRAGQYGQVNALAMTFGLQIEGEGQSDFQL